MTYSDDWLTIHVGDNRAILPTLPPGSVHCVVTSPPYWSLRDYGHVDQLGLERTPEEYVANMVAVFREVRRVLRDDGTLWLNLGDSYAGGQQTGRNDGGRPEKGRGWAEYDIKRSKVKRDDGLKPKDLVGIPWRVAFALQADGWYLRSDIIWAKPNPMPESVTDRPTKSHEYLFLLAKSDRYFFDADAVREGGTGRTAGNAGPVKGAGNDDPFFRTREGFAKVADKEWHARNIRSVWTIATQPYPGSHFATFPPKLVEPCIKAGTSERGVCPDCGAPWRRVVERGEDESRVTGRGLGKEAGKHPDKRAQRSNSGGFVPIVTTTGWRPTCDHEGTPVPATVMDPFGGSGTTAMVAQSLSRRAVLIELNPGYVDQALGRNSAVPLGLDAA